LRLSRTIFESWRVIYRTSLISPYTTCICRPRCRDPFRISAIPTHV